MKNPADVKERLSVGHRLPDLAHVAQEIDRQPARAGIRTRKRASVKRAISIIWHIAPLLISLLRDWQRFLIFGGPRDFSQEQHRSRAIRIREKIEHLGTLFIKVGQVLSSRGDLFPKIYIDELSLLQDAIVPLPGQQVRLILEREYGEPLTRMFDSFSDQALAAASIGQVHRAVFRGQDVVIKFLRPGVEERLRADFLIARWILNIFADRLGLWQAKIISSVVSEVRNVLFEEIDYEQERVNAETLRRTLADRSDVIIPAVVPELCSARVVAFDYHPGTKISRIAELQAQGFDFDKLMHRLVGLYARMIFIDGVYHADPHPGNIYITNDGKIVLLDFGIVRHLSQQTRDHLIELVLAALRGDVDTVVERLYQIGLIKPEADRSKVREIVLKIADLHFRGLATRTRMEEVAHILLSSFEEVPIQVPAELVYIFRCLSMLEGLGTRYKPGWNMVADGAPAIRAALGQYIVRTRGIWETVLELFRLAFNRLFGL